MALDQPQPQRSEFTELKDEPPVVPDFSVPQLWEQSLTLLRSQKPESNVVALTLVGGEGFGNSDRAAKPAERDAPAEGQRTASEIAEARLKKAVEGIADKNVRDSMLGDLETFKQRVARDGLSALEYAKTLDQISRLLEAKDGQVNADNRLMAARGVLKHAADANIRQGPHGTCGAGSSENSIYARHPSVAADMVASAALDGKWKGKDGKYKEPVVLPAESLPPGNEETVYPPRDGQRDYASQLFQVTFFNDIGQHGKPPMQFVQSRPIIDKGQNWEAVRYNEYWQEVKRNADGSLTRVGKQIPMESAGDPRNGFFSGTGGLSSYGVSNAIYRLTGEKNRMITNGEYDRDVEPSQRAPRPDGITDLNMHDVRSLDKCEKLLQDLKKNRGFPIPACVYSGQISRLDGSQPREGGLPDHFVTITDYQPAADGKPARVFVKNQWSSRYDGWMPVDAFYRSLTGVLPKK